jgi:hypothetical protein
MAPLYAAVFTRIFNTGSCRESTTLSDCPLLRGLGILAPLPRLPCRPPVMDWLKTISYGFEPQTRKRLCHRLLDTHPAIAYSSPCAAMDSRTGLILRFDRSTSPSLPVQEDARVYRLTPLINTVGVSSMRAGWAQ